ncbi:MAG: hypothetical protein ACE5E5_13325 [Phycisphaerae bacterium]
MIWILATRGASTRLRDTPFTETPIEGVQSVVYKPGIASIPATGGDPGTGELGTFTRGLHRVSGFVFSYDGSAAETLFAIAAPIDLIVRYQTDAEARKRTFLDVLFVGDATVALPGVNTGVSELIGVPFRVQIPASASLDDHIVDEQDV